MRIGDCMEKNDSLQEDHEARSRYIRDLIQRSHDRKVAPAAYSDAVPRTIVQFWDDLTELPSDVWECMQSWRKLERDGFELPLFDSDQAGAFIAQKLGIRHLEAFRKCYHPAMQSDYFRLCYIFVEGGCYLDADDVYCGNSVVPLFGDGRLRIQPLCYDTTTSRMVPPSVFTTLGANSSSWIFYFNNNPLLATRGHPIVQRALAQATESLERHESGGLPEIQSTTGPGNLTKSVFELATEDPEIEDSVVVLSEWEEVATTRWPLSYRHDMRNWRLANQREFRKRAVSQTTDGD